MATQNFKRNLLILYREGKKKSGTYSFFPPAAEETEKNCLTLAVYFLRLGPPSLPACYPLNTKQKATIKMMGQ